MITLTDNVLTDKKYPTNDDSCLPCHFYCICICHFYFKGSVLGLMNPRQNPYKYK